MRLRIVLFGLLTTLLLLWQSPQFSYAQSTEETPSYWRHNAPGEIDRVFLRDLTGDGNDEIGVVSVDGSIEVLRSDGARIWDAALSASPPTPERAGPPVRAVTTLNRQIVFATGDAISAIDFDQTVVWKLPLESGQQVEQLHRLPASPDSELLASAEQPETLLVLYSNGRLQHLDNVGNLLWEYEHTIAPNTTAAGQLALADIDKDGFADIFFSYNAGRVTQVDRIEANSGAVVSSTAIEQLVSQIVIADFGAEAPRVIIGTNRGLVHLLDGALNELWRPRTLNKAIRTLDVVDWAGRGPLLVVGTTTGKLVGFLPNGQRLWDKVLCNNADTLVLDNSACADGVYAAIHAVDSPIKRGQQDELVEIAITARLASGSAETILVDAAHNIVARHVSTAIINPPLFTDSNNDGRSELLLPTFSQLELVSPNTTARTTREAWEYVALAARPTAAFAADLDNDGSDDLIVGASDGRLHRLSLANNNAVWIQPPEGEIAVLRLLTPPVVSDGEFAGLSVGKFILVGYNDALSSADRVGESHVALLDANGDNAFDRSLNFQGNITALLIDRSQDDPRLLVALDNGSLRAYQLTFSIGDEDGATVVRWGAFALWAQQLSAPIVTIELFELPNENRARYVVATTDSVVRLNISGEPTFRSPVLGGSRLCNTSADLLYLIANRGDDNQICLRDRNLGEWREEVLGAPVVDRRKVTEQFFYQPLSQTRWQRFSRIDTTELNGLLGEETSDDLDALVIGDEFEGVTAFYSGNLTNDERPDMVLGFDDGRLLLDLNESADSVVQLSGPVNHILPLRSQDDESASLAIITNNALVKLYGFRPNHPPLLTAPNAFVDGNQYIVEVSVFDVEETSEIIVSLDYFDGETQTWVEQEPQQRVQAGNARLRWTFEQPTESASLPYRFRYADADDHIGLLQPPAGPPTASSSNSWVVLIPFVLFAGVVGSGILYQRLRERPSNRARRFYREIERVPIVVLIELRKRYNLLRGDPDFFVNVGTFARQRDNDLIAALADGLFLLADRPTAGIDILNSTLDELGDATPQTILRLDEWQTMIGTTHDLLEAPTLTEMALLRAQLDDMLAINEHTGGDIGPFPRLAPIFDALADSERVDSVGDRLAYLGDAALLLRQLKQDLTLRDIDLSNVLVGAIVQRWGGLVRAATESIRGRARIEARLKTQRIAPEKSAEIVLELANVGRAAAEQVKVTLHSGDAVPTNGVSQIIPSLSPDWKRSVLFGLDVPADLAQFRVAFTIEFSDRQQANQTIDYADVVHVLAPAEDFKPIPNPYAPGTPLRRNSSLFYGRKNLFNFIAGEADRASQQHVIIMVGQRRTGKTSALLRLNQHLPDHLLPVYIDCQSLGVLPGMTPFFQDIAWLIADALNERGIEYDVPDLAEMEQNPGKWFQHSYIPAVQDMLPDETKLVLVFDEFEALENLVTDDILPKTIFSYLRHLMQHGDGLSFIFVGTHRLEEMTTDYWSVLFNIALYQEISYLDEQAALALITEPVAPLLVYDDLALDKILRVTAGHPYFLQLVCYSLVKRANDLRVSYVTISDVNETIDEMLSLGEVHFAYIWQRSDSAERAVLLAVAHLIDKETTFRPVELLDALTPYQLGLTPATVTQALNSLVRRNIMREINDGANTLYEFKLGLVGFWIERSKSLSQLYSREQIG